jgi:hypothetical protein
LTMHEVHDGLTRVVFSGSVIESYSNDEEFDAPRPQWTAIDLYEVDPGQEYHGEQGDAPDRIQLPNGGYFAHVIGMSVMYHHPDRHRTRGMAVKVGEFGEPPWGKRYGVELEDAWPCGICRPPLVWTDGNGRPTYDLTDAEGVPDGHCPVSPDLVLNLETPWHTLHRAATPAELVTQLHNVQPGRLSGPARKLLQLAATVRPEIQAALN